MRARCRPALPGSVCVKSSAAKTKNIWKLFHFPFAPNRLFTRAGAYTESRRKQSNPILQPSKHTRAIRNKSNFTSFWWIPAIYWRDQSPTHSTETFLISQLFLLIFVEKLLERAQLKCKRTDLLSIYSNYFIACLCFSDHRGSCKQGA